MPGIDGGLSANTKPSLISENLAFRRGRAANESSDGSLRSSNGFIDAKMTAALLAIWPSIRL
jgi:hypothetical protein